MPLQKSRRNPRRAAAASARPSAIASFALGVFVLYGAVAGIVAA